MVYRQVAASLFSCQFRKQQHHRGQASVSFQLERVSAGLWGAHRRPLQQQLHGTKSDQDSPRRTRSRDEELCGSAVPILPLPCIW